MPRRRRPTDARRSRAAVRWGLLIFVALVTAQTAAVDADPDLYDVEYGARLTLFRARHVEAPDRPPVLVVGSSRTVMAFAPEQLPPLPTADGSHALPFNFGHFGAGPIHNLMNVSRMLADGVRPRCVVLELMPTFVSHEGMRFLATHTAARDVPLMHAHIRWHRLYGEYALRRLHLAPKYPAEVLRRFAPDLAPPPVMTASPLLPLGGCTFLKDDVSAAERARLTEVTRVNIQEYVRSFRVSPRADAATRALLDRLRGEGIGTVLLLMPEGTLLKSWYGASGRPQLESYCASLTREYGVPVVDAREWLGDDELTDEHHALKRGAERFTRRLGRDVLGPYLASGDTSWAAKFDAASNLLAWERLSD